MTKIDYPCYNCSKKGGCITSCQLLYRYLYISINENGYFTNKGFIIKNLKDNKIINAV